MNLIATKSSDPCNGSLARLPGINVAGLLNADIGMARATEGYLKALQSLGLNLACKDLSHLASHVHLGPQERRFGESNPYPFNLICLNPPEMMGWIQNPLPDYLANHYNIGFWWWELPSFPEQWVESFNVLDEVWVGSSFVKSNLKRISPVPVTTISPFVWLNGKRDYDRGYFGLPDDEFLFLFAFDFFSDFERKNPLGLIAAFKEAFSSAEPVRLIIKCSYHKQFPAEFDRLRKELGKARITIIDRPMDRDEIEGLIAVSDCYCSLHRAEGFGLPLAEAMLSGKPVIATAWSGNMDFMTAENSYLVDYKLVPVSEHSNYPAGDLWAEASLSEAAQAMRAVFEDRAQCRHKASLGADFVRRNFGLDSVKSNLSRRLHELATISSRWPSSGRESRDESAWSVLHSERALLHNTSNLYCNEHESKNGITRGPIAQALSAFHGRVVRRALTPVLDAQTTYNVANIRLAESHNEQMHSLKTTVSTLKRMFLTSQSMSVSQIMQLQSRIEQLEKSMARLARVGDTLQALPGATEYGIEVFEPPAITGSDSRLKSETEIVESAPVLTPFTPSNVASLDLAQKQIMVSSLPWFHSMKLADGLVSNGTKSQEQLARESEAIFKYMPAGKSVIDVGAWDGFFSFEAKRRGASRVLATDHFSWVGEGWGRKDSFVLARELLEIEVEDMNIDPMDLGLENVGMFDVVLFLGVLYHLKHPLFVLEKVAGVCKEHLVLETHLDTDESDRPSMVFYPGAELAGDPTNWWGPNRICVTEMLKVVGFRQIEFTFHPDGRNRGIFHAFR